MTFLCKWESHTVQYSEEKEETRLKVSWHFGSPRIGVLGVRFQEIEGRNPNCMKAITRDIMDNYIRTNSNLPRGSVAVH